MSPYPGVTSTHPSAGPAATGQPPDRAAAAGVAATRPGPPSLRAVSRARAAYELKIFFREPEQVIFSFAYPIIMLMIFGSVFRHDTAPGGVTYIQYFLAGIAATGIMVSSFQALAARITVERSDAELARLQALGTPAVAYFAGKATQVLATTVLQLATLLVVARLCFSIPLPPDAGHWLTFAWVLVLGSLSGTVLGIATSMLPRNAKNAGTVIAPITIVLQFFSGVFFVYRTLPGWMRQVAAIFPLKWLTQGMRSVFLPDGAASAEVAGGWEHGRTALVLGAWIILGVAVCARRFTWRQPG